MLIARARETGNEAALRELEALGPPPYTTLEQLGTMGKWMSAFGGLTQRAGA
ncbi:MAG: hypothetical protein HC828_13565 [Blastochloris sp.]|nr:hypothetical protein [Blastochloris sp.]